MTEFVFNYQLSVISYQLKKEPEREKVIGKNQADKCG
jgi:hypothetical protein